jgi:hypothetical protein
LKDGRAAEEQAASTNQVRPETLLAVGDALERGDLVEARGVIEIAAGAMIPAAAVDDENPDEAPRPKRKRRKEVVQVDPSGYPTIASLDSRQVAALVRAAWARCHGSAIDRTGQVAPLRALEARDLVERAPMSVSGRDGKGRERVWYAATAMGALVVLKALLKGSPRVVKAALEVRNQA